MTEDLRLHGSLIGAPGGVDQLNTPVLVLDIEALDRNLAKMAGYARGHGVALRPHAKTHKSVELAKLQIGAGAVGVCCAKLGEAEALAEAGVDSVLLTSPVVSAPAIRRLVRLNARMKELIVVVDHPDNVSALATAVVDRPLDVLVDIDPGIRRTGVASPAAALELAGGVHERGQLRYRGVQMYCGLQQHIAGFEERGAAIRERMQYLREILDLLGQHGLAPEIVSGSGTGTCHIDASIGVFTEWQVGSYAFMDRQYFDCDLSGDGTQPFEPALFVDASVISANTKGMATIDAGFKALAADGGAPKIVSGAPAGSTFFFMGDEHGAIIDPQLTCVWKLGDRIRMLTPHCDPTVNLYDSYHVVRGDTLVAIWPVSARGRSR
jgi:3-hydroxy-D-aspartate aldolase